MLAAASQDPISMYVFDWSVTNYELFVVLLDSQGNTLDSTTHELFDISAGSETSTLFAKEIVSGDLIAIKLTSLGIQVITALSAGNEFLGSWH